MRRLKGGGWTCQVCGKTRSAVIDYEGEPGEDTDKYVAVACGTLGCKGSFMQMYSESMKKVTVEVVPAGTFKVT